jgi:cathepsin C
MSAETTRSVFISMMVFLIFGAIAVQLVLQKMAVDDEDCPATYPHALLVNKTRELPYFVYPAVKNYLKLRPAEPVMGGFGTFDQFKIAAATIGLPTSLDWRERMRSSYGDASIAPIEHQGKCGACWAYSTASMLAWRTSIWSRGAMNLRLSAQDVVNCSHRCRTNDSVSCVADRGCKGGTLEGAMVYMMERGAVTQTCVPYLSAEGTCSDTCADGSPKAYMRVDTSTARQLIGAWNYMTPMAVALNVMSEVMARGPVAIHHKVFANFYAIRDYSIYKETAGADAGGHALLIIGWGGLEPTPSLLTNGGKTAVVDAGVPYWIVQNSWGPKWGDGGYGRIAMGLNVSSIESISAVAGNLPLSFANYV